MNAEIMDKACQTEGERYDTEIRIREFQLFAVPPNRYYLICPLSPLTECLECGATYEEPGHVEPGGMSCDRCN